jgi:uncharacterized protein (TIGR03083 family)
MSAPTAEWSPSAGRDIVSVVEIAEHINAIEEQGVALADAAERAGLDAAVPTCPDWLVRDLVRHQGQVHRWSGTYVLTGRPDPGVELEEVPADGELPSWFRQGHARLVDALKNAPSDLAAWAFLPAPSPLAFWARRQAHETTIHRADAEAAAGERLEVDQSLAVDGIDELLLGFYAGRGRRTFAADPPLTLGIRTTDASTDDAWSVVIGPEGRETNRGTAAGDCVASGTASDIYQFLWNRRDRSAVQIDGDAAVLDLWREQARITWS